MNRSLSFLSLPAVKLISLGILITLMFIPIERIKWVNSERESRAREAENSIESNWGGRSSTVFTPWLEVAVTEFYQETVSRMRTVVDPVTKKSRIEPYSETETVRNRGKVRIFPANLVISANTNVTPRSRGIFKSNTFESEVVYEGEFKNDLGLANWRRKTTSEISFDWPNARIVVPISSRRSLKQLPTVELDHKRVDVPIEPDLGKSEMLLLKIRVVAGSAKLDGSGFSKGLPFKIGVNLKGTGDLSFMPYAQEAKIQMKSNWLTPSFKGILPAGYKLGPDGFSAEWQQSAISAGIRLVTVDPEASLGLDSDASKVEFFSSASVYRQVDRLLKYSFLFLIICFGSFYLIDLRTKASLHLVQYTLVGTASTLFFLSTLSLAEHVSFPLAYSIGVVAVSSMIAVYAKSFSPDWKIPAAVFGILSMQYGVVFVLLEEGDYALLGGSALAFLLTALAMWFTRSIHGGKVPVVAEEAL